MPAVGMRKTTLRMVDYDWFGSYREFSSVAHALDRIAQRIRFENNFSQSIEDITANAGEIEAVFVEFFPKLKNHIHSLAIEN